MSHVFMSSVTSFLIPGHAYMVFILPSIQTFLRWDSIVWYYFNTQSLKDSSTKLLLPAWISSTNSFHIFLCEIGVAPSLLGLLCREELDFFTHLLNVRFPFFASTQWWGVLKTTDAVILLATSFALWFFTFIGVIPLAWTFASALLLSITFVAWCSDHLL